MNNKKILETLEKLHTDTFYAIEKLIPKNKSDFLLKLSSYPNESSNDIKIDERAYHAISIPLWEILGRKGKGWRSYSIKISCEAVGGDFNQFMDWLAFPEILHVGSLIIDDIQDNSKIRRGDKTCHLIHGLASSINAGTYAYFVVQKLIDKTDISEYKKLALYREYITLLREAHIGQGLDIVGLVSIIKDLEFNSDSIFDAVIDIHRRKTGLACSTVTKIGAILGGGTDEQIAALGIFFEELGILFQIKNDINNVKGMQFDSKQLEDIESRKITLPVAYALKMSSTEQRKSLLNLLSTKNLNSDDLIATLFEAIQSTNSIQFCNELIKQRYKKSFKNLYESKCNLSKIENIHEFAIHILEK